MIRITRDSGYANRLSIYKVVLDGTVVGEIRKGQQLVVNVTPGKHRLQLKIDWCSSNFVDFEMNDSDLEFHCGSTLRDFGHLLALLYITFYSDRYLWLRLEG